jgi:hypothetical protein
MQTHPNKKMEEHTMSLFDLNVTKDDDDDEDTIGEPEPGSDDNSNGPKPDSPPQK